MTYFTTNDGYTLTVYSSLYMDYGLTITKDGEELFSNPHVLSHESYGSKPSEDYDDMDEAEEALDNGDENAIVPWEDSDWANALEQEADELIEAYIGKDYRYEIIYNDGCVGLLKLEDLVEADTVFFWLIDSPKMQNVTMYKLPYHSSTDDEAVVLWWGNDYWANEAVKFPALYKKRVYGVADCPKCII